MNTDKFECTSCGATEMTEEDVAVCCFQAHTEEPAEYELRCPDCKAEATEMSAFWCRGCEDAQVPDDGDYCSECTGAMTEARTESMKDWNDHWEIHNG